MVRPIDRMTERRQIRRAAEEALEEMPTDPQLPVIVLPADVQDPTVGVAAAEPPPRDDLPPGFGGPPRGIGGPPRDMGGPPRMDRPDPHAGPYTRTFTTLTFRALPEPWYRTNAFKLTIVGLLLLAAIVSVVVLLWPSSTPTPQDTAPSTPAPSSSLTPSLSTTVPPPVRPPAEPPPPPPPPPSESAPPPAYYPPYYGPPKPTKKPRIDVTRTPISVSPTVKPKASGNSSTPGDNDGGGGGWW